MNLCDIMLSRKNWKSINLYGCGNIADAGRVLDGFTHLAGWSARVAGFGHGECKEIKSEEEYRELIADQEALPDTLPGALLNTVADTEHFLSAGYDDGAVVLASGSQIFTPLDRSKGSNVMRFAAADQLIESGYVWDENRRQLAFKPYMMAQETGRGMTIGFAHDPSTRAFLDGLDLLIANAVLVAPSRVR